MLLTGCGHIWPGQTVTPIPSLEDHAAQVPAREGSPAEPAPLTAADVPEHPYMADHGSSCMHADPFTTNTYAWAGPLGHDPEVVSHSLGFLGGECPTVNFDQKGRIVSVCVRERRPSLVLMDPKDLRVLASHALPRRRTPLLRIRKAMQDTSGGAYFYLDAQDRAVVGTADGAIQIIALEEPEGEAPRFVVERRINLKRVLRLPNGSLDRVTAVMPDYDGNYWFTARYGTVGVVTRGGRVRALHLSGEELQNSFSVGPDGVYIVSDHALYRFGLDAAQRPSLHWREPYDRGEARKVGQINQGSGTTPTLLGDDYIAIADNAEPRLNVLVYRRHVAQESERLVCRVPVFEPGASATENTLIGHGRTLIVENNAGYDIFRTMRGGKTSAPGLARIDIREDESGCDIVWESNEISQTTVPKLSTATGLVYVYTKRPDTDGIDAYYFTAIDFHTGETRFRILTGTGVRYDNNWAAITLAPDGSAYVGVLNGLLRVRDGAVEAVSGRGATNARTRQAVD
jgi:hypothetical protein